MSFKNPAWRAPKTVRLRMQDKSKKIRLKKSSTNIGKLENSSIVIVRFLSIKNSRLAKKYNVDLYVKKKLRELKGVVSFTRGFLNGCYYFTEDPPAIEVYWDVLVKHYRKHWSRKDYVWIGVVVKLLEAFQHELLHCLEDFIPVTFKFEGEVRINNEGLPY